MKRLRIRDTKLVINTETVVVHIRDNYTINSGTVVVHIRDNYDYKQCDSCSYTQYYPNCDYDDKFAVDL